MPGTPAFLKEAAHMSAALKRDLVSVDDYLASELRSPVKHEYLAGVVYTMAGARNVHNDISSNIHGSLLAEIYERIEFAPEPDNENEQ
jgi:hypothetical protein